MSAFLLFLAPLVVGFLHIETLHFIGQIENGAIIAYQTFVFEGKIGNLYYVACMLMIIPGKIGLLLFELGSNFYSNSHYCGGGVWK